MKGGDLGQDGDLVQDEDLGQDVDLRQDGDLGQDGIWDAAVTSTCLFRCVISMMQ